MVFGAFGTMLYPAQPYIAANLGVSIEQVTLIWSLGKNAFCFKYNFIVHVLCSM